MSWMPDYRDPPRAVVIELVESFGHFHLADPLAPRAMCGKRGRVARLLPPETWEGAAGPFPSTFCGRCSTVAVRQFSRTEQLAALRAGILARYAHNVEPEGWRVAEFSLSRTPVGTGYVDIAAEVRLERLRREAGDASCTDYMPQERSREEALIYA